MLDREHPARAAHPRLYLVGDKQHAVLRGDLAQPPNEMIRRHDIAALALDRLDDNRRHFVGRHQMGEDLMLEVLEAFRRALVRVDFHPAHRAPVAVRVRRVVHARHHRTKSSPLHRFARRQRERPERAAVEPS